MSFENSTRAMNDYLEIRYGSYTSHILIDQGPGGCFTNSDRLSDRATDHPPMLFIHSRMVRRPVGQSVAVSETPPWTWLLGRHVETVLTLQLQALPGASGMALVKVEGLDMYLVDFDRYHNANPTSTNLRQEKRQLYLIRMMIFFLYCVLVRSALPKESSSLVKWRHTLHIAGVPLSRHRWATGEKRLLWGVLFSVSLLVD